MRISIHLFLALAIAVATIVCVTTFGNTRATSVLNNQENTIDQVYLHSSLTTTTTPNVLQIQPLVRLSLEESISEDIAFQCSMSLFSYIRGTEK